MATIPSESGRALLLNISLQADNLTPEQVSALQRYTGTADGVIGRQFLVPEMMKLRPLHYAIQAGFGWRNEHAHRFVLPAPDFERMTNGLFREWRDLVGVYFRVPDAPIDSYYTAETPQRNQTFRSWLRNNYNGPYAWYIGSFFEHLVTSRLFLNTILEPEVEEEAEEEIEQEEAEEFAPLAEQFNENGELVVGEQSKKETLPDWDSMTTEEASERFKGSLRDLIERTRVGQILAPPGAPLVNTRQLDRIAGKAEVASAVGQHMTYPLTVEMADHTQEYEQGDMPLDVLELQDTYERVLSETDLSTIPAANYLDYYYGPNEEWHLKIECIESYTLVGYQPETLATQLYPVVDHTGAEVLEEAQDIVSAVVLDNKPICTGVLGPNVMDGMAGMGAFADFLTAFNSRQRDERTRALRTANQNDWTEEPPEAIHVL